MLQNNNLAVLLVLVSLPLGNGQLMRATINRKFCANRKTEELGKCWSTLPPTNGEEIPSNPHLLENACRLFNAGIRCVENWTKTCLKTADRAKIEGSIDGSIQTYRVLCLQDRKFRSKFLQHIRCYNNISIDWDNCTKRFFNTVARTDHTKDGWSFCCTRVRYFQCVTKMANGICSADGIKFMKELAKSLLQYSMPSQLSRCSVMQVSCTSSPGRSGLPPTKVFCGVFLHLFQGTIAFVLTRILYFSIHL